MSKDFSSIDTSPVEGRMREFVMTAPGKLLGQEVFYSSRLDNLRELWTITEGVRQEKDLNPFSKFFFGKSLTIKKLPNHRFSRWNVSIQFDP